MRIAIFIALVFAIAGLIVLYKIRPYDHNIPLRASTLVEWGNDILTKAKIGLYPRPLHKITLPLLYINLDRDVKRERFMQQQFTKYDINAKRISALDGKFLTRLDKGEFNGYKFINNYFNLSAEELACTLSHLKAIATAEKENYNKVIIVEDDCCFDMMPFWNHSLDDISKLCPDDWEIIQLFTLSVSCSYNQDKIFLRKKEGETCYSTVAYLINEKGIKKVLDKTGRDTFLLGQLTSKGLFPQYGTTDKFLYDLAITYVHTRPILFPYNITLESTIHPEHTEEHIKTTQYLISLYIQCNYNSLPLISDEEYKMGYTLRDIDNELQKINLNYFLVDGTLLGAFRQNNFIQGTI
jgi:GR25 family glycosyltransferase involved in LPS biosynthesis